MIPALTLGAVLGLFSGVVPGPYSALIAATALEGGFWAGFRLAILPLVTETVFLMIAAVALAQLPVDMLRWIGFLGGALLFYLAIKTWRASVTDPSHPEGSPRPRTGGRRRMVEGTLLALLSPAPWVFWLLVGGPLFLASWQQGKGPALAFMGAFLGSLVGVHVTVAGVAAFGHRRLPLKWRLRLVRATSIALLVGGVVLLWQASVGNFSELVAGTRGISEMVGDTLAPDR